MVQPQIAAFTRVCAYDRAGLAWSDAPSCPRTFDRIVDELSRVVAQVAGDRRCVLVGHSFGSFVVRAYAARHPERVAALALISPAAYRDMLPIWAGLTTRVPGAPLAVRFGALPLTAGALLYTFVDPRRLDPRHVAIYARYLWGQGGAVALKAATQALYSSDLERLAPRYPEIRCPALLLHGTKDRVLPKTGTHWLARDLPSARVEWLEGLGHFPQEEAPERVAEPLLKFLEGIELG